MLSVWFVRHGETTWNVERRIQGGSDIPLNAHGRRQARLLAESLQGIPFDAIYSSDLQRAMSTAQIVARYVNQSVMAYPALRERAFGEGEGLVQREIRHMHPHGFNGRESDESLEARCQVVLDLMAGQPHKRVLCVSHGGFIRTILKMTGLQEVPALNNTSISCLRLVDGNWTIAAVNWSVHLQPLQSDIVPAPTRPKGGRPVLANEYRPDIKIG